MPALRAERHGLGGRILAVYADRDLYVGALNTLTNFSTGKVLCRHEKSVRCISGNDEYVGCCSYDGTATVLTAEKNEHVERIEGPDTEMKGIAFCGGLIAIATRGKTVWILEDMEVSKILDDHTQDVKGCRWFEKRLYSWSYDNTVNVYEMFEVEHSWELMQSIDLGDIVWNVVFYDGLMCAVLQNGSVVSFEMHDSQWVKRKGVAASAYPITSCCVAGRYLAVVCNRDCLVLLSRELEVEGAIVLRDDGSSNRADILCCCFWESEGAVVCGSEDGTLYKVKITDG